MNQIPRGLGITIKHLHGLQREIAVVFSEERELIKNVVGRRKDVTAYLVLLDDVEHFAWTGPQQFVFRFGLDYLDRIAHYRYRINSGISDTSGKNRDDRGCAVRQILRNRANLVRRHDRRNVELHAGLGQPTYQGT